MTPVKQINIKLPLERHRAFAVRAAKRGVSKAALGKEILLRFLAGKEGK